MSSTQESSEVVADDLVGVAKLLNNIKENNVTYMVALLVAYQIGILDKLVTYGSGMC